MPARGSERVDPRLAAEFNRLFALQYDRVRDFLILHYAANRREEAFWDYLRTMTLPDTLRHKMELFAARGTVPDHRFGLFARDSWLSVLVGQGIVPQGYDRLADALPLDDVEARLADLAERVAANVGTMTPHAVFVDDYCGAGETVAA